MGPDASAARQGQFLSLPTLKVNCSTVVSRRLGGHRQFRQSLSFTNFPYRSN
jgi:hypothetical protein